MARPNGPVLKWLDGAAKAARRARHDPRDADALHDFRINIRRLLVHVKIVKKQCGVPAKLRKRLRRTLRDTGPWRDAHIESIWLANHARQEGRRGATALAKALSRDRPDARGKPRWWREVHGLLRNLQRVLEANRLKKTDLRAAQLKAAEKEWRGLARRLRRLNDVPDKAALHKARISAKKLRYILEALGSTPRGLPATADLRRLQQALGDVHDHDVITADAAAVDRSAALASPRRSALARLARERQESLISAKRDWNRLLGSSMEDDVKVGKTAEPAGR